MTATREGSRRRYESAQYVKGGQGRGRMDVVSSAYVVATCVILAALVAVVAAVLDRMGGAS